jgi:hypothetical protein
MIPGSVCIILPPRVAVQEGKEPDDLQRDSLPIGCGLLLAALVRALLLSSSSRSFLEQAMVCCPACFPCILPVNKRRVRGREVISQLCTAGPNRHNTSVAWQGGTATGSTWIGNRNRRRKVVRVTPVMRLGKEAALKKCEASDWVSPHGLTRCSLNG